MNQHNGADAAIPAEDLIGACGHVIAFVVAPNKSARAGIVDAVRDVRDARTPAIFILADLSCADEAVEAVRTLQRKSNVMLQASELDFEAVCDTNACGLRLEELPRNLLEVLQVLAESVLDVYEAILVVDATQPSLTTQGIYHLCRHWQEQHTPCEFPVADTVESVGPAAVILSRIHLEELLSL